MAEEINWTVLAAALIILTIVILIIKALWLSAVTKADAKNGENDVLAILILVLDIIILMVSTAGVWLVGVIWGLLSLHSMVVIQIRHNKRKNGKH